MNHLLGPYVCRRRHWWSPSRKGRRTRATNILGRNISMAPKNIQIAAMDSLLFDYVEFNFLLKLHIIDLEIDLSGFLIKKALQINMYI